MFGISRRSCARREPLRASPASQPFGARHPTRLSRRSGNRVARQLLDDATYDQLGDDGFVIRSVGQHVVIAGATSRGTRNGVYWLLDRKLGVRWLSANYTHVPSEPTLQLDRLDERQVPRFAYREIFSRDSDHPWFRARNLLNGSSHHRRNLHAPDGFGSWSDHWPQGNHNFEQVVNKNAHGKEHPDYFAGGQLAMMNERVRQIAADNLSKRIGRRNDQAFGFSQEDRGWNPDRESRAFAEQHGGALSAPLIDMLVDVAKRVREDVPDARRRG